MRPDDNWRETRACSEDLSELLGIPVKASEDFLLVLENLIVHRFVEQISQEEGDMRNKDIAIELPYLGTLIVSFDENCNISTNFVTRKTFKRKLKNAYTRRVSPLVSQVDNILGEDLVNRVREGEIVSVRNKRS